MLMAAAAEVAKVGHSVTRTLLPLQLTRPGHGSLKTGWPGCAQPLEPSVGVSGALLRAGFWLQE